MTYNKLLKNIWSAVYDPKKDVVEIINTFFHEDYEQCINGISMKRTQYIQHVLEQKQNMTIDFINYKYILEKDNELFALYYPKGRNIDNQPIEAEVLAYFRFENKQLIRIHGQVRLIKGDLTDVDMKNP